MRKAALVKHLSAGSFSQTEPGELRMQQPRELHARLTPTGMLRPKRTPRLGAVGWPTRRTNDALPRQQSPWGRASGAAPAPAPRTESRGPPFSYPLHGWKTHCSKSICPHLLRLVRLGSLSHFLSALVKHGLPFTSPMCLWLTCDQPGQSWAAGLSQLQGNVQHPTSPALPQHDQTQTSQKPQLFGQGDPCKMSAIESSGFL